MRIHIEKEECEGHGLCAATAPALYELDDEGYAAKTDIDVPDELADDAESGMYACPMSAIKVLSR